MSRTATGVGADSARQEREHAARPEPPRPPVPNQDIQPPDPSFATATRDSETEEAEASIPDWKWEEALSQVNVTFYATQWCGVCRRARQYMNENGIAFTERDTDESKAASIRLGELNPRKSVPTFEIDDIVYIGFSPERFEQKFVEAARNRL